MRFTPDARIQEIAKASALDACNFVRDEFRIVLDWSDASVQHIETVLNTLHRLGPSAKPTADQAMAFARMFGSYMGEVYRKNHGAVWGLVEINGQRLPGLTVTASDTFFWPWARSHSRIVQGAENNVWDYYSALIRTPAPVPPPLPLQRRAPGRHASQDPRVSSDHPPATMLGKRARHIVHHGLLSLSLAAFSLFTMGGLDWRMFPLFGLPIALALIHARVNKSRVAEAFLVSVGVASLIALLPWLFPRLGLSSTVRTTNHNNRLFTLYVGIYLVWLLVVLPIHLFIGSLQAKGRGKVPQFSPFTCYLGLFTASLFWIGGLSSLVGSLKRVGLLPLFESSEPRLTPRELNAPARSPLGNQTK